MNKIKILYVEDEQNIRKNHSIYIKNNFPVDIYEADDGKTGLQLYKKYKPDIILTDLNMPNMCGLKMIEEIRKNDNNVKIIVLSAHSEQDKLLRAIKLNLSDYKIKPLTRASLYAAIKNTLTIIEKTHYIYFDNNCYFNQLKKELIYNEEEIKLTKNEILLLEALLSQANILLSASELFNAVWEYDKEYKLDSIRTLIKKLRKKLPPNTIENVYGSGYKLHTVA